MPRGEVSVTEEISALKDWVYAEGQLMTSFDTTLMQAHATAQLSRALNTRRLVAVIGSGVSAGYGQPSWQELLQGTFELLQEALPPKPDGIEELQPIMGTFNLFAARSKKGDLDADEIPVAFEICENLYAALWLRRVETRTGRIARKAETLKAFKAFRSRLKWQLKDERGRAELLIRRLSRSGNLRDATKAGLIALAERLSCPGLMEKRSPTRAEDLWAERFGQLLYRTPSFVTKESGIQQKLAKLQDSDLARKVAEWIKQGEPALSQVNPPKNALIRPHLIEAGLHLLGPDVALNILRALAKQIPNASPSWEGGAKREDPLEEAVRESRNHRATLPRHRDPYAVLLDELNVKRILTTNYDGEIDRLLHARGFAAVAHGLEDAGIDKAAPSRSILMDGSFGRTEILAYETGAAAYLFNYGADTREQGLKVLHLHGRALRSESWLVLSERDYRERYARDDDAGARADAMRLIFNANPLLFIGLGMREPDILRPLRAYSEETSRLCDRPAIALLPREKKDPDLKLVTTLAKYGVYTLCYGAGKVKGATEDDSALMATILEAQNTAWDLLDGKDKVIAPEVLNELKTIKDNLVAVEGKTTSVPAVKCAVEQLIHILSNGVVETQGGSFEALLILTKGIGSMVRSTFMTAWLRRMVGYWGQWHDSWSSAPNIREPGGLLTYTPDEPPITINRHRTLLRNLDDETDPNPPPPRGDTAPETDRFFAGAPSPAFQILRASLAPGRIAAPAQGRRIIYLLSERGVGRGHVFAAMRSPRRFARLCDWLLLADDKNVSPGTKLFDDEANQHTAGIYRAFFNLGVSHEIISTFDRLTSFLELFAQNAMPDDKMKIDFERDRKALLNDRIGRLIHVLRVLNRIKPQKNATVTRAVIVLNHVDALFDEKGMPKNIQFNLLFEALMSEELADTAPIDIILMMNEKRVPRLLRDLAAGMEASTPSLPLTASRKVALLEPDNIPADERRAVEARITQALGPEARIERLQAKAQDIRIYVHFLRWMRPVTLATRFFPRAGLALAHLARTKAVESEDSRKDNIVSFDQASSKLSTSLCLPDEPSVRHFQAGVRAVFEDALSPPLAPDQVQFFAEKFGSDAVELLMLRVLNRYSMGGSADDRLKEATKHIAAIHEQEKEREPERRQLQYFGEIASAVGYGRYAMTVVLAAIDDMVARRLLKDPVNEVDLSAIRSFIKRLRLATTGKEPGIREDIALTQVLHLYQTDARSSLGEPLPAWSCVPRRATSPETFGKLEEVGHPQLFELQEAILITLALIGQPVEAAVLTGVDVVAKALDQIRRTQDFKKKNKKEAREILHATLDLLVHRCLIFRIGPKGKESEEGAHERHRFATHKSLRRHLFRQFNAPQIDYADVDQFTVSMYATQPSDLPRPTAEGHRRMRALIEQLSRYERRDKEPAHRFSDPFIEVGKTKENKRVHRARLRAAYGTLRSIYSIAVVSRFSTYEDEGLEAPEQGYFESHRLRVRWMLRMANQLDGQLSRNGWAKKAELHTFHAEEVVWLFNECGVLSLVEGRINDAMALLNQARRTASHLIEQTEWGPLHVRIGLNLALANIVRGRLSEAEQTLRRIEEAGPAENPVLVLIAKGYLILIRDLRGDQKAIEEYDDLITELILRNRYRPAAIFAAHKSDSLRSLGPDYSDEAEKAAAQASGYAIEGGHEDIRRVAQLAHVSARIQKTSVLPDAGRIREIEDQLKDIADYARLMGVPRLTCRVLLARGEFFLRQGDYRMTAELTQSALQLATRHDLEMFKVAALRLLGIAMMKLKRDEARTLLVRARELAHLGEFRAEANRIEAALAE